MNGHTGALPVEVEDDAQRADRHPDAAEQARPRALPSGGRSRLIGKYGMTTSATINSAGRSTPETSGG